MQAHPLVGLHLDVQPVGLGGALAVGEHVVGRCLEDHDDLGGPAVHPLAGAQVERHARPAPVLHLGAHRDERLGPAARALEVGRGQVVDVRRHGLAVDQSGRVAAPDGVAVDVDGCHRLEGLQHLELLVADGLASHVRGRLHGHQAQQLEQVVLDHVAHRAGLVVVAAALADAEGLGDGDLHVVDPPGVPQRLEEGVGEARDQQVLHALLAEVVVDAEDLRLREDAADRVVDRLGGGEVVPDRLLQHDPGALVDDADLVEASADVAEERRRDGEVEDAHGLLRAGPLLEEGVEAVPVVGPLGVEHEVAQPAEEAVHRDGVEVVGRDERGQGVADLGPPAVVVEVGARDAQDPGVVGQLALEVAVVERRQELAQRQVSRPAEDGEVTRGRDRVGGGVLVHADNRREKFGSIQA
nr:hypothetical protein [Nocardioides ungokensis]